MPKDYENDLPTFAYEAYATLKEILQYTESIQKPVRDQLHYVPARKRSEVMKSLKTTLRELKNVHDIITL